MKLHFFILYLLVTVFCFMFDCCSEIDIQRKNAPFQNHKVKVEYEIESPEIDCFCSVKAEKLIGKVESVNDLIGSEYPILSQMKIRKKTNVLVEFPCLRYNIINRGILQTGSSKKNNIKFYCLDRFLFFDIIPNKRVTYDRVSKRLYVIYVCDTKLNKFRYYLLNYNWMPISELDGTMENPILQYYHYWNGYLIRGNWSYVELNGYELTYILKLLDTSNSTKWDTKEVDLTDREANYFGNNPLWNE